MPYLDITPPQSSKRPAPGRPARIWLLKASAFATFFAVSGSIATAADGTENFAGLMRSAMDRMMIGMDAKPSGDVDRDFVAMMVPHHQGAIAMAVAELRFGKDEQLKRIAQEIIVDQQQEIAAMRLAVGQPLPPLITIAHTAPACHAHGALKQ